ncbi:DUF3008 family protein [Candidatus Woesearchaeota archaeon]|nr:DUF3008 family protein [Candidatus Woesearchaeota archaeon]MCF7901784.1 DUF3008 family protein [Candidatus Woesearchaeota archaeon]
MPASSKSQQRLMGMVHAYQKGELNTKDMDKSLVSKIKDMAKQMKPKDAKDFAETKHKKLPQKVESRTSKFKNFLFEYVDDGVEIDMNDLYKTINSETDPKILDDLFQLLQTRKEYQERIEQHYKDNTNMLKFPYEVVKERDLGTIDMLITLLQKRMDKIESGDIEPTETEEYPKIKKVGFNTNDDEAEPIVKQDITTAYKRSDLGYKFRHMESFMNFFVNEEKNKDPKKEISKYQSKKMREERLKSGANLETKVVPDKKKQYKRKKKVNLED